MPLPIVALPWGSRSISSTRRRVAASEAARFTEVVVLPTPPFWFAMAMTRFMGDSVLHCAARAAAGLTFAVRPLGDELFAVPAEALTRHLVRHGIGRAVLAPRALKDLGEPHGDRLDVRDHLGLG